MEEWSRCLVIKVSADPDFAQLWLFFLKECTILLFFKSLLDKKNKTDKPFSQEQWCYLRKVDMSLLFRVRSLVHKGQADWHWLFKNSGRALPSYVIYPFSKRDIMVNLEPKA